MACWNGIEANRVSAFLKPYKIAIRAAVYGIGPTTSLKNLWRKTPLFWAGRLPLRSTS